MITYLLDGIGYVELLDTMPRIGKYKYDDGEISTIEKSIVDAARVSYSSKGSCEKDVRLIKFLYRHRHTTPFEQVQLKFRVKIPLFAANQWMRHRTASYNMLSRRYTSSNIEFYIPTAWRTQSNINKQASGGVYTSESFTEEYKALLTEAVLTYEKMIENGIAREMARMVLPQSLYTGFVYSVNLHNLLHFIRLRNSDEAQYEIRVYAQAIYEFLLDIVPNVMEVFDENV